MSPPLPDWTNRFLARHFLRDGKDWGFSQGPYLRTGQPLKIGVDYKLPRGKTPILCAQGWHASLHAADALVYAPGYWASLVLVSGPIAWEEDKLAASRCRALWCIDARKILASWVRLFWDTDAPPQKVSRAAKWDYAADRARCMGRQFREEVASPVLESMLMAEGGAPW